MKLPDPAELLPEEFGPQEPHTIPELPDDAVAGIWFSYGVEQGDADESGESSNHSRGDWVVLVLDTISAGRASK